MPATITPRSPSAETAAPSGWSSQGVGACPVDLFVGASRPRRQHSRHVYPSAHSPPPMLNRSDRSNEINGTCRANGPGLNRAYQDARLENNVYIIKFLGFWFSHYVLQLKFSTHKKQCFRNNLDTVTGCTSNSTISITIFMAILCLIIRYVSSLSWFPNQVNSISNACQLYWPFNTTGSFLANDKIIMI